MAVGTTQLIRNRPFFSARRKNFGRPPYNMKA